MTNTPSILRLASLASSLLLSLLTACTSSDPRAAGKDKEKPERGPGGTVAFLVRVEASEPDVRIEANGDSIGVAPLTLKIFGDKDGTFHSFGSPDFTIRAYPSRPGGIVQTKSFGTGAWFGREDRIPSSIYFDMNLVTGGTGAAPAPPPTPIPQPQPQPAPSPAGRTAQSSGTAFAITEDGYLVTNHHVIRDAEHVYVQFPNERIEARVLAKDLRNDLAILKVFATTRPLPLGDSGAVRLGEEVGTLGFPRRETQGVRVKFGRGSISSLTGREDDVAHFQVSVPVQPGNSGGPLFNAQGEVVAVVSSMLSAMHTLAEDGSLPQGVNYAVKTAYLRLLLQTIPALRDLPAAPADRSTKPFEDLIEQASPSVFLVESHR
jgi:hypothetical protein